MRRLVTISSLTFLALFMCTAQAQAACNQWIIPQKVWIKQSNQTIVYIETSPSQGGFSGKAHYDSDWRVEGVLEGTVDGSNVQFTIHWLDDRNIRDAAGVYTGTIGPQGRLQGTSYDVAHPQTRANWWASEVMQCRQAGPAAPMGGPAKALGRAQPRTTDPRPPRSMCEAARNARSRNSPAAPGLERQCEAQQANAPLVSAAEPPGGKSPR
jgi:hypothetical protein